MGRVLFASTVLFMTFSCHFTVESHSKGATTIEGLQSCERVKMELVPAVCGKCRLRYEENKLYIIPAHDCPRYEVYKCITKEGKVLHINNLRCSPELSAHSRLTQE